MTSTNLIQKFSKLPVSNHPEISIIINHYGDDNKLLIDCLNTIIDGTNMEKTPFEIVLALDKCCKETVDMVSQLSGPIKYLNFELNVGKCLAANAAVKLSSGHYLIMCDSDILILDFGYNSIWIEMLLYHFKNKTLPNVGQVGVANAIEPYTKLKYIIGFMFCTLRRVWDEVEGYDPIFFPAGGEDIDYSIKLNQLGYDVMMYQPEYVNSIYDSPIHPFLEFQFPMNHVSCGCWYNADINIHRANLLLVNRYLCPIAKEIQIQKINNELNNHRRYSTSLL